MTALLKALRRRYPGRDGARQCLRQLGVDENVLDNILKQKSRLAFDASRTKDAEMDDDDKGALLVKLDKLICENLDGPALQEAQELLHEHLGGRDYDRAVALADDDEPDDDEPDEEALREERREAMAKIADHLAKRQGMDEEQIEDILRAFPANGLERVGGALAEDLAEVMKDRRARTARDKKRRLAGDAASHARWAGIFDHHQVAEGYGAGASPRASEARDSAVSTKASRDRWEGLGDRIGYA